MILRRSRHLSAECGSRVPRPTRIIEDRTGKPDKIGIASRNDCLGLCRLGNQSNSNNRHLHRSLDGTSERYLIARGQRNLLIDMQTARRYVDGIAATKLQSLRKLYSLFNIPAIVVPVG